VMCPQNPGRVLLQALKEENRPLAAQNKHKGSIGDIGQDVNSSIDSTYFQSISIRFNKSFHLFWEQRC
jgi:hypothetical protein